MKNISKFSVIITAALFILTIVSSASAKYSGGTGEPNNPYQIATAEDLIALGNEPNDYGKHFILIDDVNLAGYVFDRAVIAPDTNDTNWEFDGTAFTGVFDGNDHTISNLTILGTSYLGLFGHLSLGEVKDLGVVDVNIIGSSNDVGSLVGSNGDWDIQWGTVIRCYSKGAVNGTGWSVGGLLGENWGNIIQCYSMGAVSGDWNVGGLVASNSGTIIQCYSEGSITSTASGYYMPVGGLVGDNSGDVVQCYSTGTVKGNDYVGGLMGDNCGIVTQCYSTGAVDGNNYIGGLMGDNSGAVTQCYSVAAVDGNNYIGGLMGDNSGAVTQCYGVAAVDGNNYVGGLVGRNESLEDWWSHQILSYGTMTQCYSTGAVSGTNYIGGLLGENWGNIIQCYSTGAVDGNDYVGGLVGSNVSDNGYYSLNWYGTVTQCYSTGSVDGNGYVGGLVGNNRGHYDHWLSGIVDGFWDTETSGQTTSDGGTGKTSAEMKTKSTFTSASWDFVGDTVIGTDDIWSICEGTNYPRLAWQIPTGDFVCPDGITIEEDFDFFLNHWGNSNCDQSNGYCDGTDLDLSGIVDIDDLVILINQWLAENP